MNKEYCKKTLNHLSMKKDITHITKFLNRDAKEKIIEEAEKLVNNTYTFNKPWDMERCKTEYQLEPLDFDIIQNDDEEWCFMLNRMDYLSHLYLASLITGEERYVQRAKEIIQLWIEKHKILRSGISTRTLDTAIRIMNMIDTIQVLLTFNIVADEELDVLLKSITDQIQYLKDNYILKYKLSNWGSIQTAAILSVLPLIDENYHVNPIMRWAKEEYNQQMQMQVYEDGMHWEQSTMYHIEVLNMGLRYLHLSELIGFEIDLDVREILEKMVIAVINQALPNGTIEMFGDSDVVSIDDVSMRASVVFKKNYLRGCQLKSDADDLFLMGTGMIKQLETFSLQPSARALIFDGEYSGMYTLKNSLLEDSNFTMFTNGSLGSGHGHCDNLHISLVYHGDKYFVDSGRFTYREDHSYREILKGVDAHNSMNIDGIEHSMPKGSWEYTKFCAPIKNIAKHEGEIHYYEGVILANNPQQTLRRRMIVIDSGIWLVVDEGICDGNHELNQVFHMDKNVRIERKEGCLLLKNKNSTLQVISDTVTIEEPCVLSYNYNEIEDSTKIILKTDFRDVGISAISITDESIKVEVVNVIQGEDSTFDKTIVTARKYILNENESYVCILFHQEIFEGKKICTCEGVHFHAKVVVLYTKNGKTSMRRIKTSL